MSSPVAICGDPSPKEVNQAAQEFAVGGVQIGTSLSAFQQALPEAAVSTLGTTTGYRVTLDNGLDHPQSVFFHFKDSRIVAMTIEYSALTLHELSGDQALLNQLISRFGTPTKVWESDFGNEGQVHAWQLPDAHRWISFMRFDDGTAHVFVRDYPGDAPPAKTATSKWGFDLPQTAS